MARYTRQIPNTLTMIRIALALLFPAVPHVWRFPVVIAALLTEYLDGAIARMFSFESKLGQLLDPIADKIFFAFVIGTLLFEGRIRWFELLALGVRDISVALGTLFLFLRRGFGQDVLELKPQLLGKATTALQYLVFLGLLFSWSVTTVFLVIASIVGLAATLQYVARLRPLFFNGMSSAKHPKVKTPQVVIVGAGFGGLNAAKYLRHAPVKVTLIDRTNHHLFQPLLYQVATAGLSPADIATPVRSVLRGFPRTEVLMEEVIGVDTARKRVVYDDQRALPYDYLILATGATYSYFGKEGWSRYAYGLKTLPDAIRIREKLLETFERAEFEEDPHARAAALTIVVVGGGPTGVEVAGAIGELAQFTLKKDFRRIDPRAVRIVLIEAGKRILPTFSESLSESARRRLERLGVELKLGMRVEKINEEGVGAAGEWIRARNVVWAAGVQASTAGKWLGCQTDRSGRVRVMPDLSVPGHPEVFVIGDTASCVQKGKALPGVAPVALQQGRYVAELLIERIQGIQAPFRAFRYRDKGNLATVGRRFAIAEIGRVKLQGFFAWLVWVVVHIYYLIGYRNRLIVLLEWAWAYLTFQSGARLITRSRADAKGGERSSSVA